ncbi:hypothetical protein [Vibrio alginolyticus]|uniref:hypothetical protein n=1 Tax=Vibrio alginolyticus TaxID=663 RepID=UPI0006CAA360|nr:hypothetical protein [Vibrio alginolyticus]KPM98717.1 hypothetical protein AOG25_09970 [Vibrio alginolyticus]CAH7172924.1 conserved exported hypothetical protein [Vibrio chagasii]CAH7342148.1 conserved exported hypothetical protein [Vibrio chagasii]
MSFRIKSFAVANAIGIALAILVAKTTYEYQTTSEDNNIEKIALSNVGRPLMECKRFLDLAKDKRLSHRARKNVSYCEALEMTKLPQTTENCAVFRYLVTKGGYNYAIEKTLRSHCLEDV